MTSNKHLIAYGFAAFYALALFQRVGFTSLTPVLTADFSLNPQSLSHLAAIFFWSYLALQIPAGLIADAIGSIRAACIGLLITCIGCLAFAAADSHFLLMSGRFLLAAGTAFAFTPMIRFMTTQFTGREGVMTGRGMLIGNIGAIVAGAPLAILLAHLSYQAVMLACAALCLLVMAILLKAKDATARAGCFRTVYVRAGSELREVLTSPWCFVGIAIMAGVSGSYYGFSTLIAPVLLSQSTFHSNTHVWLLFLLILGYAAGTYIWASLVDRVTDSTRPLMMAIGGAATCWAALQWMMDDSLALTACLFLALGVFSGSTSLIHLVITQRFPARLRGSVIACVNCGLPFGAAVSQTAFGKLSMGHALYPMLISVFVALICGVAVMYHKDKPASFGIGATSS